MDRDDIISPGSYFLIRMWVDKERYSYGPYIKLQDAITLLVDHIPSIALKKTHKPKFSYKAEIQECLLTPDGEWSVVSVPIVENQCRRWQTKPKE